MTQFVWFYIQAPDSGEELRLSMESVKKNFTGELTFLVVGEKPAWYKGPHFPLKQFKGINDSVSRMAYRDTQHKIMQCAQSDLVEKQFVWIMDDCYMMKPTSLAQIRVPHYDPWYRVNMTTTWHQLVRITFAALAKKERSNLQYGTHLPHVFDKTKLLEMFDTYEFPGALLLFEVLYGNTFYNSEKAVPYGGIWQGVQYPQFLTRILKPVTRKQLDAIDAHFMNYKAKVWNPTTKLWLQQRFEHETV